VIMKRIDFKMKGISVARVDAGHVAIFSAGSRAGKGVIVKTVVANTNWK
jgi:hypothetical protein